MDRLLKSGHFGEPLTVDWLDAARYADTNGYFGDKTREIWPWRDWVIRAFNDGVPYDVFTIEQLAGDLLPGATPEQGIATGFNRNHMVINESGVIDEEYRVEYVDDRLVDEAGGLAQRRDGLLDELRLYDRTITAAEARDWWWGEQARAILAVEPGRRDEWQRALLLKGFVESQPDPALGERHRSLRAAAAAEEAFCRTLPRTLVMEEVKTPRMTRVLARGQYDQPAEPVTPGVPAFLPRLPRDAAPNRLGLARWLVSPDQPLTPR